MKQTQTEKNFNVKCYSVDNRFAIIGTIGDVCDYLKATK